VAFGDDGLAGRIGEAWCVDGDGYYSRHVSRALCTTLPSLSSRILAQVCPDSAVCSPISRRMSRVRWSDQSLSGSRALLVLVCRDAVLRLSVPSPCHSWPWPETGQSEFCCWSIL
jgi:hypothetical protein